MHSRLNKQPLPLWLCGAVLACAGCLATVSGRITDAGADPGAAATEQENATSPSTPPVPARHLRASMSMPYFSFAQVLRSRS